MADVVIADGVGELDLDGEDDLIAAFDDQVDLVLAAMGPQMPDARFSRLGVDADVEGHQRLEELTE